MTRQKKSHQIAAARACEGKAFKNVAVKVNSDIDTVVTSWTGGVNNHKLEQEWINLDELSEEEVSELEGDDLIESLCRGMEHEEKQLNSQAVASTAELITVGYGLPRGEGLTKIDWKKVESKRSLGYNRLSERTARWKAKQARDKAVIEASDQKR